MTNRPAADRISRRRLAAEAVGMLALAASLLLVGHYRKKAAELRVALAEASIAARPDQVRPLIPSTEQAVVAVSETRPVTVEPRPAPMVTRQVETPVVELPAEVPPGRAPAGSEAWLAEFDRAMDREFRRLEARERLTEEGEERRMIREIKDALLELDGLWGAVDAAGVSVAEQEALRQRAQELMGHILQLGVADRNMRLSRLARAAGLTRMDEIAAFVDKVDQVYRDTHMDWASLFSRGY